MDTTEVLSFLRDKNLLNLILFKKKRGKKMKVKSGNRKREKYESENIVLPD